LALRLLFIHFENGDFIFPGICPKRLKMYSMFFEFPIFLMCRFLKFCKEIPPLASFLPPREQGREGVILGGCDPATFWKYLARFLLIPLSYPTHLCGEMGDIGKNGFRQ
jgi:hypothetical protein